MADIAFANNWTNLFMINTTPNAGEATWARIGAGINSADPTSDDEISEEAYYDGEGNTESDVVGGKAGVSFSGHRKYGDPAQDYVASVQHERGSDRVTDLRWIAPDGSVMEGPVTLTNIKTFGGAPNDKAEFSFEADFRGKPEFRPGDATQFPEALTAKAVSVKVGEVAAIEVTATPDNSSAACVYGVEDDEIATVDASGAVRGVKAGKTKVSVKSAVKPSIRTEVEVTVTAAASN